MERLAGPDVTDGGVCGHSWVASLGGFPTDTSGRRYRATEGTALGLATTRR